tara:strand:+ start:2405 stop:2692 length:288 start_codon:yes stop_codon:yes gene_type:complete
MTIIDTDSDGVIDAQDVELSKQISELQDASRKHLAQLRLARYAMVFMAVYTLLLFAPFVSDKRIELLTAVSDLLYISLCSVICAFFGFTSYMQRK